MFVCGLPFFDQMFPVDEKFIDIWLGRFFKNLCDFLASFPKARFSKVFCIFKFGCC